MIKRIQTSACPILVCLVFSVSIFSSCNIFKHHQKTNTTLSADTSRLILVKDDSSKVINERMKEKLFRFETFSGKAKIAVTIDSEQNEYTSTIRMNNDSAIWISMGQMGIEGVRVFITPDSIRIIDKINRKYFSYDFSFVEKLIGMKMDFQTIQNLIAGTPIYYNENVLTAEKKDSSFILRSNDLTVDNTLELSANYFLRSMKIKDNTASRDLMIRYFLFDITMASPFCMERLITIKQPKAMEIKLTFTKAKMNEPVKFPFNRKGD